MEEVGTRGREWRRVEEVDTRGRECTREWGVRNEVEESGDRGHDRRKVEEGEEEEWRKPALAREVDSRV